MVSETLGESETQCVTFFQCINTLTRIVYEKIPFIFNFYRPLGIQYNCNHYCKKIKDIYINRLKKIAKRHSVPHRWDTMCQVGRHNILIKNKKTWTLNDARVIYTINYDRRPRLFRKARLAFDI